MRSWSCRGSWTAVGAEAAPSTPLTPNSGSPILMKSGGCVGDSSKKKDVDQLARMRLGWWSGYELASQSSLVRVLIVCPRNPSWLAELRPTPYADLLCKTRVWLPPVLTSHGDSKVDANLNSAMSSSHSLSW